jgi:DNA-binding transcriptional LysR family regulator
MNTSAHKQPALHNFDWSLIRSFLAALDQGSLLGAARVLQMSQPTVGRHVAELESQLGVVLFERTGRGLVPTAMALQLAAAARGMEAGALQLSRTLSGAKTQSSGTVRITASVPVAVYLMPPVLAQLRLALPEILVELVSSNQM